MKPDWKRRREWALAHALRGIEWSGDDETDAKALAENVPDFPGWQAVDKQLSSP